MRYVETEVICLPQSNWHLSTVRLVNLGPFKNLLIFLRCLVPAAVPHHAAGLQLLEGVLVIPVCVQSLSKRGDESIHGAG